MANKPRIENWNGNEVRFVYLVDKEEWYAVGKDVAEVLGYINTRDALRKHVEKQDKLRSQIATLGQSRSMTVISEFGIYDLVFGSELEDAKKFKRWVYSVIKTLRKQAELHQYEVLRFVNDTEIQKNVTSDLYNAFNGFESNVIPIKANTIADKTVSNMYGFTKMVKKEDMTPEMLLDRQPVYDDTVQLMKDQKKYELDDLSISKTIYKKYNK